MHSSVYPRQLFGAGLIFAIASGAITEPTLKGLPRALYLIRNT